MMDGKVQPFPLKVKFIKSLVGFLSVFSLKKYGNLSFKKLAYKRIHPSVPLEPTGFVEVRIGK